MSERDAVPTPSAETGQRDSRIRIAARDQDEVKPERTARAVNFREQILRGAEGVFEARGLACAVEEILKASNVSRRTFYRFFGNKEEVLFALFTRKVETYQQRVLAMERSDTSVRASMETAVSIYVELLAESPLLTGVAYAEANRPGSAFATRRLESLDFFSGMLQERVAGELGVKADAFVFRALLLACEALVIELVVRQTATKEELERAKRAVLDIMFATFDGLPHSARPRAVATPL